MNSSSGDLKKRDWRTVDARRYHSRTGDFANEVDREVIEDLIAGLSGRALDLPSGSGRMTPLLRKQFITVSSDYPPTMLEFASSDPEFNGVRTDAFALAFADQAFDLVHCLRLSFHYENFDAILSEFHRILKPDGILVFDSLNPWTTRWLLSFPLNLLRGSESRRVHFRSQKRIETLLASRGFEVVRLESRYLLPTRLYRFLPGFPRSLFRGLEKKLPTSWRVLTYWKVRKRGIPT
jgi:SAM-dependent methyltransferase